MINRNTVAFTIVEMDERGRRTGLFVAKNGIKIMSERCPSISPGKVYVRGSCRDEDALITIHSFDTDKEASEYADRVAEALEYWADKAPCFKDNGTSCNEFEFF